MPIILGVDPGLSNLGYGIIDSSQGSLKYITAGTVKTSSQDDCAKKLNSIHQELAKLIEKYQPDTLALEELFFCKNTKTAMAVGQVIGVIILLAGQSKIKLLQFKPLEIKMSLTSYGLADKKQIALMVHSILGLKKLKISHHATDALACAICGAQNKSWQKN